MKMYFVLPIILIFVFIAICIYIYFSYKTAGWKDTDFANVGINGKLIKAEIASSPLKKSAGLSSRESLSEKSGMLFIFPEAKKYSFWMKGMKFPIDIIWINENKVVDISKNVQIKSSGIFPTTVSPSEKSDMVLEVNAGFSDKNNIKIGDSVTVEKIE